jgi:hypothetical protein
VITVGVFVPLIVLIWIGLAHPFHLALVFFAPAAAWALLVFFCWAIATREYRVEGATLEIEPNVGASKRYDLFGVDEVAMKRQPLRRAFAFRAMGTYGPFGFHGRYRAQFGAQSATGQG